VAKARSGAAVPVKIENYWKTKGQLELVISFAFRDQAQDIQLAKMGYLFAFGGSV
jgi:hypothetical protein